MDRVGEFGDREDTDGTDYEIKNRSLWSRLGTEP